MKYLLVLVFSSLLLAQKASACYKCGVAYADPHIDTFDGNKFQCQGEGDFILSKSQNTDFEFQGRFFVPESGLHSGRNGSSTVGAVLSTGVGKEAKIEVQVTPPGFPASSEHDCDIHYWVNGVRKEFNDWDASDDENGYTFKRRTREHINPDTQQAYEISFRQFFMSESRAILWMSKGFDEVFGCYMNAQLCVPCDFHETHDLVGLFGSPNEDKTDDFTTRSGERVDMPPKLGEQTTYCKSNWCVGDAENSQFLNPDTRGQCTAKHDVRIDELVAKASKEIKQECDGEVDCITDTIVTGDIEIGKATLEGQRDMQEHSIEEEIEPTEGDRVEEDDAYTCTKAGVGSKTAFAYPANGDRCFLDDGHQSWGWSLKLDGLDGSTSVAHIYSIVAGADGCDINKGEVVGTVTVAYFAHTKECTAEYQATDGHSVQEWQFYCGPEKYPVNMKTGRESVAPGLYSCVRVETDTPFSDTCKVENVEPSNGKIHAIVHAVSCDAPPTASPTLALTPNPTARPTNVPTTAEPSGNPTHTPTSAAPTNRPTLAPTTATPSAHPTPAPTKKKMNRTPKPTPSPTNAPTTANPTNPPTLASTTATPSVHPTPAPTKKRRKHTPKPTPSPTNAPTTATPTDHPTDAATTAATTDHPTLAPTEPEQEFRAPPRQGQAQATDPTVTNPPAPDELTQEDKNTTKAFTKGDPHFKTFGGEMYDYHGECDLVLLQNPNFKNGLGMNIHIRTKIESFWSSVESAVVQLGDDTMEIRANPDSKEWLWLNGREITSKLRDGKWNRGRLAGFLIRYKQDGANAREAFLYLKGSKEVLVLKTFKTFVRVDVNWEGSDNYDNSVGLLGSHAHNGKRLGRDGKTFIENVNEFGQEWQVRPEVDGSLFHSYEGAIVGQECILPPSYHEGNDLAASALRGRRLGASALDTALVEKACDHLVDPEEKKACMYDVIATQDLNMASAW